MNLARDVGVVEPLIGRTLNRTYHVERLIARGGMGAVYEAHHLRLRCSVALKALIGLQPLDDEARRRFEHEVGVVKELGHPNITHIMDVDVTDDGVPFFVMEYLEGETLRERLKRERALAALEAVRIISDVCSALADVHAHGFIHCDVKPGNVFLQRVHGQPPFVKVLDFGISLEAAAARTHPAQQTVLGTPCYMAPEQAAGLRDLDARVDQYAVAAMTYEMLSGTRAVGTSGSLTAHERRPLAELAPWLPSGFDEVLEQAMAPVRDERFPSISRFAWALGNVATTAAVSREPGGVEGASSSLYRHCHLPEERLSWPSGRPASEPPTSVDGGRSAGSSPPTESRLSTRVRALAARMSESRATGKLDDAVEHAEVILDLALRGADAATLRVIASCLPAVDRVCVERVGSLEHVLSVGPEAPAMPGTLSLRALRVLTLVEEPMRVADVIRESHLPIRECIRLLATLLRRRALVAAGVPPGDDKGEG